MIAATCTIVAATLVAQGADIKNGEAFWAAGKEDKVATLRAVATRQANLGAPEMADIVSQAVRDSDPSIRQLALATIASRAAAVGLVKSNSELKAQWQGERRELRTLYAFALGALDDADERVRYESVGALQALDFDGTAQYGRRLSSTTTSALIGHYPTEASPTVRSVIIAVLGGAASNNPEAGEAILKATRDSKPAIRQLAIRAIMELGSTVALPSLIAGLGDDDSGVQTEAAVQIAKAGAAAKPYIAEIEAASSKEKLSPLVRPQLESVLQRLR
jgi:HEAT repeat protein